MALKNQRTRFFLRFILTPHIQAVQTRQGHGDYLSNGLPLDNHMGEVTDMPSSNSDSVNHRSNVPVTFRSTQDESIQDPVPSDLGFLVPNREQGRTDGSVLHVDVVSISSSIYSSSNSDTSSREARRNSRRLFRDAFSRRSSRRHVDSPTIVFSTDNTDNLESHDRWLLDFSGDFFDDGIGSDSGYMSRRIHRLNERRRHSRSEIWERLRGGLDENGRRTSSCPSGLHPDGTCSCESFLMAEDSSARGSISRIVMLAEALFEVLDEIHRQPVSLSLSMMSLPAPESVVDSFPLKNHKKLDRVKGNEEDEQCYICLAEYEEGDKIRVLPCHHEYHMACVDKWLKEIHGYCYCHPPAFLLLMFSLFLNRIHNPPFFFHSLVVTSFCPPPLFISPVCILQGMPTLSRRCPRGLPANLQYQIQKSLLLDCIVNIIVYRNLFLRYINSISCSTMVP
ncbi:hypothetical protein OIU77_005726 [Salix suchowensis]|uniref:RING-type domain-containing protein n=1 Tax=Salix suchowensis TaxID=1278906 RepID=A0ABQ9AQF2_9ROSI|nr:hypothetical protein OIU77_005726 [Salix suchowensis]